MNYYKKKYLLHISLALCLLLTAITSSSLAQDLNQNNLITLLKVKIDSNNILLDFGAGLTLKLSTALLAENERVVAAELDSNGKVARLFTLKDQKVRQYRIDVNEYGKVGKIETQSVTAAASQFLLDTVSKALKIGADPLTLIVPAPAISESLKCPNGNCTGTSATALDFDTTLTPAPDFTPDSTPVPDYTATPYQGQCSTAQFPKPCGYDGNSTLCCSTTQECLQPTTPNTHGNCREVTPTPQATNTPHPTNTTQPTSTPQITNTPLPTNTTQPTNTPQNTNTPLPTNTTRPTNTPIPQCGCGSTACPSQNSVAMCCVRGVPYSANSSGCLCTYATCNQLTPVATRTPTRAATRTRTPTRAPTHAPTRTTIPTITATPSDQGSCGPGYRETTQPHDSAIDAIAHDTLGANSSGPTFTWNPVTHVLSCSNNGTCSAALRNTVCLPRPRVITLRTGSARYSKQWSETASVTSNANQPQDQVNCRIALYDKVRNRFSTGTLPLANQDIRKCCEPR